MIKYLMTLLLIFSNQVFGQHKLDVGSFVMGLIEDGTKKVVKEEKLDWERIEEFAPPDFELMDLIDSLINIENLERTAENRITSKRTLSENNGISNMYYSKQLAKEINKNYKFKFHGEWQEAYLPDRNKTGTILWKMYIGHVKSRCLKNDNQRASFLLGAFVCFGNFDNGEFKISIRRSQDKFDLVVNSLKRLRCEIVKADNEVLTDVDTKESHIENQTVTFKPTNDLRKELLKFIGLMDRIEQRRKVFYSNQ